MYRQVLVASLLAFASGASAQVRGAAVTDHIALSAADQEKSLAFYKSLFALREVTLQPVKPGAARWLAFENGFELHIIPGRTLAIGSDKAHHLAFAVADLDALIARLNEMKHAWSDYSGRLNTINTGRPDGVRQIFLQDPDGYWLEINERLKAR